MYLEKIKRYNDIKNIEPKDLPKLAKEIRRFLVYKVSKTGGHLASNLGVVELTIAIHRVLDFPKDKLIFDVGHQSYVHKILTGRAEGFDSLRTTNGLCGFPNAAESETDLFAGGHASTAIAEGVGLAEVARLNKTDENIVVVTGDGALTGGIAFEAINNAAQLKRNLTIILNDNEMSISPNVGGVSQNISKLRASKAYTDLKEQVLLALKKIPNYGDNIANTIRLAKDEIKRLVVPNMFFEDLGILYLGPVDGHNIKAMSDILKIALKFKGPVVIHAITKKGQGYGPAMKDPSKFHGVGPFDVKTGLTEEPKRPTYTDILSETAKKIADVDPDVCFVTAAMAEGSGAALFAKHHPDRFFDTGIAEEYAVILAAALSKGGKKPVVGIYSTFLQRSFDQILMEVCLNRLPVVFAIDRAGIVGADGATHQGAFDIAYMSMMPNLTIMAPKNAAELSSMVKYAIKSDSPVAIRYPKGSAYTGLDKFHTPIKPGRCEPIFDGGDVMLFALGSMVKVAEKVREILKEKGIDAALTNARFVKPLDHKYLSKIEQPMVVTLEEGCLTGGFGMQVQSALTDSGYKGTVLKIGLPDEFIPHGSVKERQKALKIDAPSVVAKIQKALKAAGKSGNNFSVKEVDQ